MSKLAWLGVAAVLSSVLAGPASAQHMIVHRGHCAYHELGNPYTPQEDYIAWSAWRSRGGWDDRNSWHCARDSRWRRHRAGFWAR